MHNTQKIAFLIKSIAKEKDITIKQLLENCQLNVNAISELSKGKQISYINFAKIADELDCSVDYLLSRTDNPNNITNGDISHSSVAQASGNNNRISIQSKGEFPYSEIIEHLDNLSPAERRHAIADLMDVLENQYPIKKK